MSSRNKYLSTAQRKNALCLRQSLDYADKLVQQGETYSAIVREALTMMIEKVSETQVDYIEIGNDETLESVDRIKGRVLIALAVKIGSTRLIDNMVLSV